MENDMNSLSHSSRYRGKYENAISNYIKNQLQDDIVNDQLTLKEFVDPFTGQKSK